MSSPLPYLYLLGSYTLLHCIASLASVSMAGASNGKHPFNPDSKVTNFTISALCLLIIASLSLNILPPLIYSIISAILAARAFYMLFFVHFSAFFKHTANVRRARIIYEETGQKTDRSIPGYASLNTVMLSGVLSIIAIFAFGATAYYGFTYNPLAHHIITPEQFNQLAQKGNGH